MGKLCDNCIDLTGCDPISSDDILYLGPNLPCSTINTSDNLTTVIQKIDALLCFTPGAQDLQAILTNGNTSTDIPIEMQTSASPFLKTTLSFDGIKIEDNSSVLTLTTDSIILNSTTIRQAVPASVNIVDLLLPDKPTGTYTLATIDEVPIDANLLHKTGDEVKTGNLTVNNIITAGGLPNEYLMADGSTSTLTTILAAILTPNILDGDTTHAPTGNAVYDALFLKANLDSPNFTGNPTAPTPAPGDNDNSIATTSFVTDAVDTLDSNVVHLTGDESITQGTKTFTNTLGNAINVNMSNATGAGISIANTGGSNGLEITNTIGFGIRITNSSTGFGTSISNNSSGIGFILNNTSSGNALMVNGTPSATGFNFMGQNNGTATFTVNKEGDVTAKSFIKTGGLASQFLKANGTVDSTIYAVDSTVLHVTGNESWTGIKSSTNTGATQINGLSLINSGTGTSRVLNILNQGGGYGIYLDNTGGGIGMFSLNQSTGAGFHSNNTGTGIGFSFNNDSSGDSIYMTNQSTGDAIQIQNASTGYGIRANNIDGGIGIYSNNQAAGIGLLVDNLLAGHGIIANAGSSATGYNFIGRNNGANTFLVDKLGNLTSNSYIKQGGTAVQYLMADGSVTTAANITIPATQVTATPHIDYLTGSNVQLQLDQTETNVVGLYKIDKTTDKTLKQTGRYRSDTDVSVLSISPADTLNITACDNILFVNEILPDSNANKVPDFLKSFGNKSFVANGTNTPLPANTRGIFYVGLDKLGNQVYRTAKIYDQDVAYLARILVNNTAGVYTIVSFKYFPDLVSNKVNNRDRFVLGSGYIVPSGAASISFGNRGMSYTKNSINYSNNKLDPNYLTIVDSVNPTPMSFLFFLPNITSLAVSIATSTVIDPTVWYLASGAAGGGAVNPIHYQVYKLFITVTGTIGIQTKASTSNAPDPGVNAIFATREAALAGLTSTVFPDILPAGDSIALGTFYLRAGMAVNGSTMLDPNDFYFRPFNATASSSLVGVTNHDALSGKNDNPAFQHVTTTDITNWNIAYTNRITSLTTTGTSGAATLIGNVLNIPIYAPGTGGTGYIQNQNASQQAANMWISGTGRFDTSVRSFDFRTTTSGFITYDADNLGTGTLSIRGGLLGNVMFFNTSGSVGIGTTNPVTNAGYGGLTLNGLNGGIFSIMVNGTESARLATLNTYTTLYTTGATPLTFGTNAAERMRISDTGNVGIGTTNPTSRLEINNNSSVGTWGIASIGLAGGARDILIAGQAGFSNGFTVQYNGTEMVYGFLNGNVGIGTSGPTQKLEVAGSVLASSFIKNGAPATNILLAGGGDIPQSTFAPGSGSGSYIQNQNASAQSANMWISGSATFGTNVTVGGLIDINGIANIKGNIALIKTGGSAIFSLNNDASAFDALEFNASKTVIPNGNVGIGVPTPTEKLHVEGKVFTRGIRLPDDATYYNIQSTVAGAAISLGVDGGTFNRNLHLGFTGNDAVFAPTLSIINQTGNVGIGTTNPSEKLEIIGAGFFHSPNEYNLMFHRDGFGKVWAFGNNIEGGYIANKTDNIINTFFTNGGNVLIGTTTDNGYKLRVVGGGVLFDSTLSVGGSIFADGGLSVGTAGNRTGALATNNAIAIGDADTGFLQAGDGTLDVYTNGVFNTRFVNGATLIGTIDNNGIGRLQVGGTGYFNSNLFTDKVSITNLTDFYNTGVVSPQRVRIGGDGGQIMKIGPYHSAGQINFEVDGITGTQNLAGVYGSGHATFPNGALHSSYPIIGGGTSSKGGSIQSRNDVAGANWWTIENQEGGGAAYASLLLAASGNTWGIENGSAVRSGNALEFVLDPQGGRSTKMIIRNTGKVGINYLTPQSRLEVEAGLQSDSIVAANSAAYFRGSDVGVAFGQFAGNGNYASWVQSLRNYDNQTFALSLNPAGSNVLIGKFADDGGGSNKLQVNGNITAYEGIAQNHVVTRSQIDRKLNNVFLGNPSDYYRTVVLLHKLDNSDPSATHAFSGQVYIRRFNGLYTPVIINITSQKVYNDTYALGHYSIENKQGFVDVVTFNYNGIKWLGAIVTISDASPGINVFGDWTQEPILVPYYDNNGGTILNNEIYSSITPHTYGGNQLFDGTITVTSNLYASGGMSVGTAGGRAGVLAGTVNAIAIGDNDTGIIQAGDGLFDVYSNGVFTSRHSNGRLLVGSGSDNGSDKLQVHGGGYFGESGNVTVANVLGGNAAIIFKGSASGSTEYEIGNGVFGVSNGGFGIRDRTNGVNRISIAPNGNVGIGTSSSPSQKFVVVGNANFVNTDCQVSVLNENALGCRLAAASVNHAFGAGTAPGDSILVAAQRLFLIGGNSVTTGVIIDAAGSVTASGGFFNSDARLKDVISRDGDVVKFKWKDGRDDKTHVGLIAQEVQEYMPDAVQEGADGMLSVNYIEVLLAKITAMEKEIKELKSKLG